MRFHKSTLSIVLLALVAAATSVVAAPLRPQFVPGLTTYATATATATATAPLHIDGGAEAVPGGYMVVLKDGTSLSEFLAHRSLVQNAQRAASAALRTQGGSDATGDEHGVRHVFELGDHLQGYAGQFTPDVLAFIRAQPEVAFVEQDSVVHTTMIPQGNERVYDVPETQTFAAGAPPEAAFPWPGRHTHDVEKGAPWGLARISHRPSLSLGTFNKYVYEDQGGEGVTAYVIDTGINVKHDEFEGRAKWGKTIPYADEDKDGHGHGTHCAGTIGSATYGVAKKAELVAVKVLGSGGSGSMSDVTAGVLWAVSDAKARTEQMLANPHSAAARRHKGFVANMSLGGGRSPTLNRAVNGAVANGLHFAVAAGNEDQDACDVSPAGAKNPVTVGASTIGDERAYFSNKGKCVDVFAPGLNILSTWNTGHRSVNTISGTSMATPHIVGLLAYLLSIYGTEDFVAMPDATPMRFGPSAALAAERAVRGTLRRALASTIDALGTVLPLGNSAARSGLYRLESLNQWLAAPDASAHDVESVLAPRDLKRALVRLATGGALQGLDAETPNKLAFNNATHPARA